MTPEQAAQRAAYLELNRNESRIISERLRSMLTFHGLLFAAVGVSAGQRLFALALLLSIVGFVFCAPWFYSVELSYRGLAAIGAGYEKLNLTEAPPLDAYRIRNRREYSLLPEVFLPVATVVAWSLVAVVLVLYRACRC